MSRWVFTKQDMETAFKKGKYDVSDMNFKIELKSLYRERKVQEANREIKKIKKAIREIKKIKKERKQNGKRKNR